MERHPRPIAPNAKTRQSHSVPEAASDSSALGVRLDVLQRMAGEFMAPLMTIPIDNIDSELRESIRRIVEHLDLDRGFLAQYSATEKLMVCTHFHQNPGSEPAADFREILFPPWIERKILNREHVTFSDVADLPDEAREARAYFEQIGTRSHVSFPLVTDDEVVGCLSFEGTRSVLDWPESLTGKMQPIVDVFALAIGRKRKKLELVDRIRFETLFSDISARLINVDPAEVDNEINQALAKIGQHMRTERCGLVVQRPGRKGVTVTHAWYGEGIEPVPPDADLALLFPWSYEKLFVNCECVKISRLAEYPPEADKDRETHEAMGVRSSLSIPLPSRKSIRHVIAFNTMSIERTWPDEYIPRLRLIGEAFVNALTRTQVAQELKRSYEEIRELKDKLQVEADYLRAEIKFCKHQEKIIGQSEALAKVLRQVEQVAPTDTTVLICGETGTGKELIAQAIHDMSLHRDKLMVKVNCASLPASLVESELFGREKGAYTGALTRQIGRFELADGSTIFLDEIAELPLELQVKLLRVLQESTFERLGSPRTIQVRVRVVAATNRNIREEVEKGNFRSDLYYRLNVFPITVPPLRERVEDIPLLVWAFVNEFCEKMGKQVHKIPKRDMEALQQYSWPGNIRELRNIIEHAVIVSTNGTLQVRLPKDAGRDGSWSRTLEEVESQHILNVLRHTGGRIKGEAGAARILGMVPSTLHSRMKKLGITLRNEKVDISS